VAQELSEEDPVALSMSLWRVAGDTLNQVPASALDAEGRLEDWIWKEPDILGMDLLLIGRQVQTPYAGRLDILALDADANCVILELKRDRTPREVVAQLLDYASWVNGLGFEDLDQIAANCIKRRLSEAFRDHFDQDLPEEVNGSHSMVVVASALDDSSERIIDYLADTHSVGINAVFFTTFKSDGGELLARAWFKDPVEVEERSSHKKAPWSGYWLVNIGECGNRTWEDNRRYGFLGAGQGSKYSTPLKRLHAGDKVFAYLKGYGYVGFGEVRAESMMIRDFTPANASKRLLELPLAAAHAAANSDSPEFSEWIVPVQWLKAVEREEARTFKGIFANPNIVCKIRNRETAEFLRREFGAE
jgi:hypothetical protein